MSEITLSILKPDAVRRNLIGKINFMLEREGMKIIAQKMIHMTETQASKFYEIHKERSFYNELVRQMSEYPVVVQVLKSDNAVEKYREILGATNPSEATIGTIRAEVGISVGENSAHGSDSIENAKREIDFFFSKEEIFDR